MFFLNKKLNLLRYFLTKIIKQYAAIVNKNSLSDVRIFQALILNDSKMEKIIVYFLKLIVLMAINFGNCMNNSSFSTSSSSSSSSPLDHVVIVIRHGDRAPLISFPFDRTKMDELWPMGYGHLTAEGKRRMYRLGSFLRRRYHRRLPGKLLTPRDVYIRSSAIERCLESSELIAASLCPPQGVWIWNTNLGEQWQPLPIHSVPKYRDGVSIIDRS